MDPLQSNGGIHYVAELLQMKLIIIIYQVRHKADTSMPG